ncbi:unnamed protein product [Ectocarpus sp. 4 AP-2014]
MRSASRQMRERGGSNVEIVRILCVAHQVGSPGSQNGDRVWPSRTRSTVQSSRLSSYHLRSARYNKLYAVRHVLSIPFANRRRRHPRYCCISTSNFGPDQLTAHTTLLIRAF